MDKDEVIAHQRMQIAELHSFISVSGNWKALETFLKHTAIPLRDEQARMLTKLADAVEGVAECLSRNDDTTAIMLNEDLVKVLAEYKRGPQYNTENSDE